MRSRRRQQKPEEEQQQHSDSVAAYNTEDRTPKDCKKLDGEQEVHQEGELQQLTSCVNSNVCGPHEQSGMQSPHQNEFGSSEYSLRQELQQRRECKSIQQQEHLLRGLRGQHCGGIHGEVPPQRLKHDDIQPLSLQQKQPTNNWVQQLQPVAGGTAAQSNEDESGKFCKPDVLICSAHLLEDSFPTEDDVREADEFIATLRAWRCSAEAAVQQQLQQAAIEIDEHSEEAATANENPALQLNHVLERGAHVMNQLQAATARLKKEVQEVQKSLRSTKEMNASGMKHVQAAAVNPVGLPSIGELSDEVLDMELRVAALSELHHTWEREQVEAAGELRRLQQELGQYCHDIEDVLEEAYKTDTVVLEASRRALQQEECHSRATGGSASRVRERVEVGSPSAGHRLDAALDVDASASAATNKDVKEAIDSLLRECQQVEHILDAVLRPATATAEDVPAMAEGDR